MSNESLKWWLNTTLLIHSETFVYRSQFVFWLDNQILTSTWSQSILTVAVYSKSITITYLARFFVSTEWSDIMHMPPSVPRHRTPDWFIGFVFENRIIIQLISVDQSSNSQTKEIEKRCLSPFSLRWQNIKGRSGILQ